MCKRRPSASESARLEVEGWNYGGVRRWMQRSGKENTDGDGVEQDLFQKNELRQNPCPPSFLKVEKISLYLYLPGW